MFVILSDGERYISYSPHLGLVGYGKTQEECINDFDEAINSFVKFHGIHGNLHAKLISCGYRLADHKSIPPKDFSIPTNLLEKAQLKGTGHRYATA